MKKGIDYIGQAVATFCHDGKGKYLLGLRSNKCRDEHLRWDPMGSGAIEFGDTIDKTIHKEIMEECNAEVIEYERLGVREVFREIDGKPSHWIQHDFKVLINPENVKINEPDKCLEMDWFSLDEFPEPMHSQWATFYKIYKDKL